MSCCCCATCHGGCSGNTVSGLIIDAIMRRFSVLEQKGDQIMATLIELQDKIEAINTAVSAERTEVQGLMDELRNQIQSLQQQLSSGALVSQAQLDALAASADAVVARVQAISEPAV